MIYYEIFERLMNTTALYY